MKKLLFVFVAAALAVSCGGRDYYFAKEQSYAYNDPEAEFDTLSYAVGMNLGLNVHKPNLSKIRHILLAFRFK